MPLGPHPRTLPVSTHTLTTHRIEVNLTTALGPKPDIPMSDRVELVLRIDGARARVIALTDQQIQALNDY
jgi:hypothetical protein